MDNKIMGNIGPPSKSLQVAIQDFRGIAGIDIREWYAGKDGSMHPTKKGIRVSLNDLSKLISILEVTEAQMIGALPKPQQASKESKA